MDETTSKNTNALWTAQFSWQFEERPSLVLRLPARVVIKVR